MRTQSTRRVSPGQGIGPQGPDGVMRQGRVLLLDDDPAVLRSYARILERAGFTVVRRSSASDMAHILADGTVDAVVSDISMPGMDGTEVLRMVRERNPDIPVILITGEGDLRTAAKAVELKAMRYLLKPVDVQVLIQTVGDAVKQHEAAAQDRRTLERVDRAAFEQRDLGQRFTRALASLYMVHQPIVSWRARSVFAYEALMRAREPGLSQPLQLLAAAERIEDGLAHLGRAVRRAAAGALRAAPAHYTSFVNLHPYDLYDEELYAPGSPLSTLAGRAVLEITECASLEGSDELPERLSRLRLMGYRIALDDLGAGYASLSAFAHLDPHAVKLDKSLTRGVEMDATKQKLIASMNGLCRELGILVVGEGVETADQRDVLTSLGCDLLQGYLFAVPAEGYPSARW
jgi:EAL domain-containing protein (putative c-di-GMP-specific phosphodiesterase class I)